MVYTKLIYAVWKWKELDLPRITQKLSKTGQKWLIYLVEDVSMIRYIVVFIVVVNVFGIAYYLLTPIEHGIGQNLKPISDVTFFTGIYFSVVTISSLGYGHMHPMGFSKALACLEVLFGLAVIGIMIAKVTSHRLSHHVSRLFASDAQKRLENIATKFQAFKENLNDIMLDLVNAYQGVPGQASPPAVNRSEILSKFRRIISDLNTECVTLRDYFSSEIKQGKYFQSVPVTAVTQVGNAIDDAFLNLGQIIEIVPSPSKLEIFDSINRQMIFEALNSQKKACDLVTVHATDEGTLDTFQRVKGTCERLPTSYFAVPEESQPDQVFQGTNEPQEPPGADNQPTDSP